MYTDVRAFYLRERTNTNRLQFKHGNIKYLIHSTPIATQDCKLHIRIRWYV